MRLVPTAMTDAWHAEDKVGPRRPTVRATISMIAMKRFPYDTRYAPGGDMDWVNMKNRMGHYTTMLFGVDDEIREIPNIRSYSWSRSVDSDVAEATLTLKNTARTAMGEPQRPGHTQDFDLPGFLSASRGDVGSASRWGFNGDTGWKNWFVPDRLVKTYEGYGSDPNEAPGTDPNLVPSGTWLIDTVTSNSSGDLVLKMRDLNRLLLDQIVFPPVIPYEEYPLSWEKIHSEMVNGRAPKGGNWSGMLWGKGTASSSNDMYAVELDASTGKNYVEEDGSVHGHSALDAVTKVQSGGNAQDPTNPEPYWLSTGQESRWSKVWWEFEFDQVRDVSALRMSVIGGPYVMYVSLQRDDGSWIGNKKIPYEVTTKDVDLQVDKKVVYHQVAERAKQFDVVLKKVYPNVKKVRITFTRLWDTRTSELYPYAAGLKTIQVYWGTKSEMGFGEGQVAKVLGNYQDFTDIVKWVCAWGGFFWPGPYTSDEGDGVREDYIKIGWSEPGGVIDRKRWVRWDTGDMRLAKGRAWGDFMNTGTAAGGPKGRITVDQFDKQPLLDIISYIRDIIGYLFYCDEQGAAVWRMPNIFEHGNYLSPTTLGANTRARTTEFVTIDDTDTLLDWSVETSSESNREVIFVSDLNGRYGVAVTGYAPANAGLRRTAGWCVDTETEIFTKRGWLRYDQVRDGDETLSLDGSGMAVWQSIREIAIFDAEPRKMVQISGANFSAVTTSDHRWPIERYKTSGAGWESQYVTTDKLTKMDRIRRSAPGGAARGASLDDALVEVVAWLYTEGSMRDRAVIYQSPTANPGNCESIRLALKRLFGDDGWRSQLRKGCEEFILSAARTRELAPYLVEKAPTMEFLTALTQSQLEVFIGTSIEADGYRRPDGGTFFYQNVGPRLDSFLSACALAGVATSVHVRSGEGNWHGKGDVATVTLLRHETAAIGQMPREGRDYDGIIWCPAMPEHHNWLARRAGSVYFTGNTDAHFESKREARVMADMIATRQMHAYRRGTVRIPGYPAIQIDDQIRIFERVTSETYFHYVTGIECDLDMESGEYTYNLTTHWLGEDATSLVVKTARMAGLTQAYIAALDLAAPNNGVASTTQDET